MRNQEGGRESKGSGKRNRSFYRERRDQGLRKGQDMARRQNLLPMVMQ
jgi:hypothetical protein